MRILILIACLFAFTAGSFADMAHAAAPDHVCAHHQMNQDNNNNSVDAEPCHSEQDQSQCDDCCCVHSHSVATVITPTKTSLGVYKQIIIVSADGYYSAELSGLKRPPRL